MGVFAKKFKAEIGAGISFLISMGLVLTSKESWTPAAPILGLIISLLFCKALISRSIKSEKNNVNLQSDLVQSEMLSALKMISDSQEKTGNSNSFSKLTSILEENLIKLFENKMKSISDGLAKVKELESENEEIERDLTSSLEKLIKSQKDK
ncbi:hypothetical protein [Pantoea sp. Haah2121]|jgi:hypothetical protein|uniref:hypothetical protein n=1 Tax=Pantoea sp. Haah2121 TaxID=3109350 RepID=UPI002FFFC0D9